MNKFLYPLSSTDDGKGILSHFILIWESSNFITAFNSSISVPVCTFINTSFDVSSGKVAYIWHKVPFGHTSSGNQFDLVHLVENCKSKNVSTP